MRVVGNQIVQGKTTPCVTCHGLDLMGVADVPPIAGRSPSYIARQMWDIQQGTRNGAAVQLMKLAIANLNGDDLVSIAAYVSSRVPPRSGAQQTRASNEGVRSRSHENRRDHVTAAERILPAPRFGIAGRRGISPPGATRNIR